jgi:hypothetical protein
VAWDGGAGTADWNEPTNWTGDSPPATGGHACIALPGASVSLPTGAVTLASLQVADGSGLLIAGGTLELTGPEASTFASLVLARGTLAGAGTRTISGSAVLDDGTLGGGGTTVVAPGASLQVGSGNGGRLTVTGGHVLRIEEGARMTWGPGPHDITLEAPSRLENAGTLEITNDRSLGGSGTLANTGTITKRSHGGTGLGLTGGEPMRNDGVIEVQAGLLDVGGPGIVNAGTLRIGAPLSPPGAALRTTGFSQTAEARHELGLTGRAAAARAGTVVVGGAVPGLAGALVLSVDPTFEPADGRRLLLVSSPGEPDGRFEPVSGTDAGVSGPPVRIEYGADGVALVAGPRE